MQDSTNNIHAGKFGVDGVDNDGNTNCAFRSDIGYYRFGQPDKVVLNIILITFDEIEKWEGHDSPNWA